jgi:hypothetical protein
MAKIEDPCWHLNFRTDQVELLNELLDLSIKNLVAGSAGSEWLPFAKRVALLQLRDLQNYLMDKTS